MSTEPSCSWCRATPGLTASPWLVLSPWGDWHVPTSMPDLDAGPYWGNRTVICAEDPEPPVCPWCGRRMSACQCEDDEVGF